MLQSPTNRIRTHRPQTDIRRRSSAGPSNNICCRRAGRVTFSAEVEGGACQPCNSSRSRNRPNAQSAPVIDGTRCWATFGSNIVPGGREASRRASLHVHLLRLSEEHVTATQPVPAGPNVVTIRFHANDCVGTGGRCELEIDGRPARTGEVSHTIAWQISFHETLDVGDDGETPQSPTTAQRTTPRRRPRVGTDRPARGGTR